MKILLTVAYDGTAYCGWQRQKNGDTVQERLETVLSCLLGQGVTLLGSSRTDAGVHAKGLRACFTVDDLLVPLQKLPMIINNALPRDIVVTHARLVSENFHPQYDAISKTYQYSILNAPYPDPFLRNYSWFVPSRLDYESMCRAAEFFVGTHDFSAFCATGSSAKTTTRTIFSSRLSRQDDLITYTVKGGGFLYNMVRIITGTLVYVGLGKIAPQAVAAIILSKDRTLAGKTAPPNGLTLLQVNYDFDERFDERKEICFDLDKL